MKLALILLVAIFIVSQLKSGTSTRILIYNTLKRNGSRMDLFEIIKDIEEYHNKHLLMGNVDLHLKRLEANGFVKSYLLEVKDNQDDSDYEDQFREGRKRRYYEVTGKTEKQKKKAKGFSFFGSSLSS